MQVDYAIGTTFSLDLLALTTIPLALTGRDFLTDDSMTTDKLALLHGIRSMAGRMSIFCNAGQIKVPSRQQPLFGYLENSVFEVTAPNETGVFHPKLWVVRYSGNEGTIYRVICSSRNLTFDRSWDCVLMLEGLLTDRKRPFGMNSPLSDFVGCLPQLVLRNQLPVEAADRIRQFSEELRIVSFEDPDDLKLEAFHPLGIKGHTKLPFRALRDRVLIVSPFLAENPASVLEKECADCIIISRSEELDALKEDVLQQYSEKYVLNSLIENAAGTAELQSSETKGVSREDTALRGLHAKIYVSDDGWNSRLWIGSANATTAAFTKNVEFLVELSGKKSLVGIDAILDGTKESIGLRNILQEYQRVPVETDDASWRKQFDEKVLFLRNEMSRVDLKAAIAQEGEQYRLTLELQFSSPEKLKPPGVQWSCWPITCDASCQQLLRIDELTERLDFGRLPLDMLTEFFAFQLHVTIAERSGDCSFVLRAPMSFSRAKREEALLRRIIQNENDLLRYLLLSSADEAFPIESRPKKDAEAVGYFGSGAVVEQALFETLTACLSNEPHKLHEFEKLMTEIQETESICGGISSRFTDLWAVIADASRSLRGEHGSMPR